MQRLALVALVGLVGLVSLELYFRYRRIKLLEVGEFERQALEVVQTKVPSREWEYIIIHHTGTREGRLEDFKEFHTKERGWEDVGYHFVINNGESLPDGFIEVSDRWRFQRIGAHTRKEGVNNKAIGVALVGDFDKDYPRDGQLEALVALLRALQTKYRIPKRRILCHSMVQRTRCPGDRFPFDLVLLELSR